MDFYHWFPALYRADTMHLTAEQDGIYRRLIDHYMETRQPLPDNDYALARIAGVSFECFGYSSAMLKAFFKVDGKGFLRLKRCDLELQRQDRRMKSLSERGKNGASKRWNNQDDNSGSHATAMPQAMQEEKRREEKREVSNPPNPLKTKNPKPEKMPATEVSVPEWIPKPEWDAWIEMRDIKRAPTTAKALQLAIGKLEELRAAGEEPAAILNQSTLAGWTGLFTAKRQAKQYEKQTQKSQGSAFARNVMLDPRHDEQG